MAYALHKVMQTKDNITVREIGAPQAKYTAVYNAERNSAGLIVHY